MTDMDKMMIDPWKSDDKCERCGELMDYRPGESFTASTDGKVWHYGCAPGRTAYNPDDRLREALERVAELETQLNTPEVDDFAKGAVLEAAHQRARWGADHDMGKTPFDWFWLVGYLAQKAASAAVAGDSEKAKHHTISTASALANWHLALSGTDTRMVPGAPLPVIREADAA